MRILPWIGLAWLATAVVAALRAGGTMTYVAPDPAVIVVAFLALRREALPMMVGALVLGYLVGRHDLGPTGLHALALGVTALATHLIAGSLAATGPLFFGLCCGAAVVGYHALLFLLLVLVRGHAAFASGATLLLLPNALVTAVVAIAASPLMEAFERKIAPEQRSALSWR